MENQRTCQDDHICKKNRAVPDIITFNTKDNNSRPTMGAPVYDENISIDSYLGNLPTEPEGYLVYDNADHGSPNSTSTSCNITSPSKPSHPNNSKEGDIS